MKIVTEKKDEDAEEDIQVTTRALTMTRAQRRRKIRLQRGRLGTASKTIVLELALCIPSDGIKLQSGGGHYSGCRNVQTCRTQWPG